VPGNRLRPPLAADSKYILVSGGFQPPPRTYTISGRTYLAQPRCVHAPRRRPGVPCQLATCTESYETLNFRAIDLLICANKHWLYFDPFVHKGSVFPHHFYFAMPRSTAVAFIHLYIQPSIQKCLCLRPASDRLRFKIPRHQPPLGRAGSPALKPPSCPVVPPPWNSHPPPPAALTLFLLLTDAGLIA
jgi:hypothetical protein